MSGCNDCSLCECETLIIETPCTNCQKPCQQCNKPCNCERPPCKHCVKPPSLCIDDCVEPVTVIETIELIEICPAYEEVIYNDEPQLIESNYTIHSTYNISQNDFIQQQQEAQQFLQDQQLNRKKICGGGGFGGVIHHDERESNSTEVVFTTPGHSNSTKGHVIAGIANNFNNKPLKPCHISSGWNCRKIGRHPHPSSCQK